MERRGGVGLFCLIGSEFVWDDFIIIVVVELDEFVFLFEEGELKKCEKKSKMFIWLWFFFNK